MNGSEMVELLREHKGEVYKLGAIAPKNDSKWPGPWDCAEFIAWGSYQATDKLYGCNDNQGDPKSADAWTNFFKRDVEDGTLIKISIDEAKATAGAFLLRYTEGSRIGHIVCSKGDGTTIEAASTKLGVTELKIDDRRWDCGILIPGMKYLDKSGIAVDGQDAVSPYSMPAVKILRLTDPMMQDPLVEVLGNEYKKLGLYTKKVDDIYGEGMFKATVEFQKSMGLIVDGEAGADVFKALGITN